jgi:epoxyqueuosine reductase
MAYMARHAELRKDVRSLLTEAQSCIVIGLHYGQPNEPVEGEPRIASYALGRDYHKVLRGKLQKLGAFLETAYPKSTWRACVDTAPLLERELANRAGLGWFGKHSCLINTREGSKFLIGVLLTSVPFVPDIPAKGGCGRCTACIDACPTGAIVLHEGVWQVDARRCISYWNIEHRGEIPEDVAQKMGGWTFGCDVCQDVCPFNRKAPATPHRDFQKRDYPNLEQLRQLSEEDWDLMTRGSATRRANAEMWRRNAAANLKNTPQKG